MTKTVKAAFGQSLLVCVGALILSVVLILPLLFVVHYHCPKLDALMNILILLPFAVPPALLRPPLLFRVLQVAPW